MAFDARAFALEYLTDIDDAVLMDLLVRVLFEANARGLMDARLVTACAVVTQEIQRRTVMRTESA